MQKINQISTDTNIGGIQMKNPVMTAAGAFEYGIEYSNFARLDHLGAIVAKGITAEPRPGNPVPRIVNAPSGMLNAIGLQNDGVDTFISEDLPNLKSFNVPVIVNICGRTIKEYLIIVEKLNNADGIAGIELNISCPNLDCGGMIFGIDSGDTYQLVKQVRKETRLPLLVKLSPNVTDITIIGQAAEDAGADALSAINTLLGMSINAKTRMPRLGNIIGGLSGPAIKPIALRLVWELYKSVSIPIVGIGGISNATDAIEFFIAGASAVAIGTASLDNPQATIEIVNGIYNYLEKSEMTSIQELIGNLKVS